MSPPDRPTFGDRITLDEMAELLGWGPDDIAAELENRRRGMGQHRRRLQVKSARLG